MDRYPLHRQFIPAHGKLTPVKLGGPVHRFIDRHMGNKCRSNQGAGASIYRPANGKLTPVKLGCRCIDLSALIVDNAGVGITSHSSAHRHRSFERIDKNRFGFRKIDRSHNKVTGHANFLLSF